jgi:hypothetical protein
LLSFPTGRCMPRKEIELQEWEKENGSENRMPQREREIMRNGVSRR